MKENDFVKKTLDFSKKLNINLIKKFVVFDEVISTNDIAKQLTINGEDEGTVVISRIQKKGRGRFDRIWESPDGGMYLSIILRPKGTPEKAMLLSLMTAIVISKTMSSYNLSPKIKWPNDIRVSGKKIAGVLIESEAYQNKLKYIVIGIGINLNNNLQNLSEKIRSSSTSLLKEVGSFVDYYNFLSNLLKNLDKYYMIFLTKNFKYIIQEWKNHSDTIGQKVIINSSNEPIEGKVIDINPSGFLEVILDTGEIRIISSGEFIYLED